MPTSVAQQRIWSKCVQDGNSPAWNVAVRFRLKGPLSIGRFETAVQQVLSEHEILRTSFAREEGELLQVIHPVAPISIYRVNLSGLSEEERSYELDRISKKEAKLSFSLDKAPLLRITLVALAEEEHVLLITVHHLISDGWSIGLLSNALMAAYAETEYRDSTTGADEPLQYADYSVWQTEHRQSDQYKSHEEFWREYLKDLVGTQLDAGSDGASHHEPDARIVSKLLPLPLTDGARSLARQNGATFFHVVLSAFEALQTVSGPAAAKFIGVPISGRDSAELETVVGPFVNYLPVRIDVPGSQTVAGLVQQTAAEFADLLAHSEYRFEDMLAPSGTSPFDIVFICQQDFVKPTTSGNVQLTAMPSVSPGALHALTFFLVEREDGWRASCEVDTSRHSEEFAREVIAQFAALLAEFTRDPNQTVEAAVKRVTARGPIASAEPEAVAESTISEMPAVERGMKGSESYVEFPASEAQTRYWLLDQSHAGKSTFHLRIRLSIDGNLDVSCLERALGELVLRHETLRTTFVMREHGLRQRVHEPSLPFSFQHVVVSSHPSNLPIEEILGEEDAWQFNLETGPLFRVLLAEVGPSKWILAITMAHLVADGWSCGVLQRELLELYSAYLGGTATSLQPIEVQYGDYAVNEQAWLRSSEAERRMEFWRKQLDGTLPSLDLPVEHPESQTTKSKGEVEVLALDKSSAAAVRLLARRINTTPFVIYGALFEALIFRYSGGKDLVFSTPLASRTEETDSTIGPLSVPVLLRSRIEEDWSIREYIAALHEVAMDTFDNALPFERYVESIALTNLRGRHALNQLCFFYQKAFVDSAEVAGLRLGPLPTAVTGAGFEWQLAVIERTDGVVAELQYDADLYSRASIQFALKHYERLLAQCVESVDLPVKAFSLATEEELEIAERNEAELLPISRRAMGLVNVEAPAEVLTPDVREDVKAETAQDMRMASVWEKVFRRTGLSIHANFFDLGGHSITLARLQALIQKEYGIRIGAADIFVAPTIASLAARVAGTKSANLHPRLIPIRAEGTQSPLFLISQSMVFRRMAERLGPDQPVFTIQMEEEDLQKLGARPSFEQVAKFYVDIIREVQPHGPYRIGGWCMSGWIAYEMAQQIRTLGEEVELLLVVDAWAPGYWRDMFVGRRFLASSSFYVSRIRLHANSLVQMSVKDRFGFLKERFRLWRSAAARQLASGLSSAGVSVEVKMEEQTTYVDQVVFAASRRYTAKPWPGPILLFRSAEQPTGKFLAPDMGWGELVHPKVTIMTLPGDHRAIFDDPGAQILANQVWESLQPGGGAGVPKGSQDEQIREREGYQGANFCTTR